MPTDAAEEARYAWRVLSVTSIGAVLTALNISTLDVALPSVARHFAATATEANWFLLSYLLVQTILILAFGRLADMVGRRRLYLLGLGLFTVASLGCGLAPSAGWLIALRGVQAVGGAAIITNTTALLTDAFPHRLLGVGLGLNVTVVSAGQVAGPVIGGAAVALAGWQAAFWFNVPIGAAGLVWAFLTLRRGPPQRRTEGFDVTGALLSFVALAGLVVALSEGGARGWTSPPVLTGAAAFALALPAFLVVQRRRRDPLVDLGLFADRTRAMAYLATFLMSVSRFALVLLASLFLQAAQGFDALQAGTRVVPLALGMMVASPLAGRFSSRYGPRVLSTAGAATSAAGLLLLALTLRPDAPYALIGLGLAAVGVGTGAFLTPNTSSIMTSVPASRRGIANGVRSMLQNTGAVVSTAMSLAIVTSPLAAPEKRAAYAGTLSRLPGGDLDRFVAGYRVAFLVLFGLCVASAAASLLRGSAAPRVGPPPGPPVVSADHAAGD